MMFRPGLGRPKVVTPSPTQFLRTASVRFTEAVSKDFRVLAGDATAPSLSDGEVQAVKRTSATSTTPWLLTAAPFEFLTAATRTRIVPANFVATTDTGHDF